MIASKTQHTHTHTEIKLAKHRSKRTILCMNLDGKTLNKLLANSAIFLKVADDRNK